MTMTPPSRSAELPLLMRAAEILLSVATEEREVLARATDVLGDQFGYDFRYILLYDPELDELHVGAASGANSDNAALPLYRAKADRGLTGACVRSREIVNVGDVKHDPRYIEVVPGQGSEICVPIVARGAIIGVLSVEATRTDAFSMQDERLLGAFAGLVALALVHAREHAARRSDIAELQAVNEVARQAADLDLDATLETVVASFRRVTTADSAAVYLWNETEQRLAVAAMTWDERYYPATYELDMRERRLALGEGMVGWSAERRQPALIADMADDARPRAVGGVQLDSKAAIVIPLVADQRLLGVIRAVKMGPGSFTSDHYRFAQTLASQATLAISAASAHAAVRRLSVTDELTGLYNARHFATRLRDEVERAKRTGRPLSLIIVDSDALKIVNDRFGHDEGNRLLISIARTIQQLVRTSDVVARFGGDEFMVLQPDADASGAAAVAERIRVAIGAQIGRTPEGEPVNGTVSIGVAAFPGTADSEDELFRSADRALYEAKRLGKDRVVIAS
ncbi:MAG TPA: diguanylate cyclase [Candidatus Limnocylindria bacterium]|jgi:diguanylate cyclase (GGDEF)-like protein